MHPVLQLPVQVPEHVPAHTLLHPIGASVAALIMFGALANATAAKIGSAPFAAFLKNSLLDWSSSFLLFFSINTEMDFYVSKSHV